MRCKQMSENEFRSTVVKMLEAHSEDMAILNKELARLTTLIEQNGAISLGGGTPLPPIGGND